jgi:hypothetical protein
MGRSAVCGWVALATTVAGGALGVAADARLSAGRYDYVAAAFLLLAVALGVGGVVVLLVGLADQALERRPGPDRAPVPPRASETESTTSAPSACAPSALAAARTTAHRHAATARRTAVSATRRAGEHAATAQRSATASFSAAVARSAAAVRSATAAPAPTTDDASTSRLDTGTVTSPDLSADALTPTASGAPRP